LFLADWDGFHYTTGRTAPQPGFSSIFNLQFIEIKRQNGQFGLYYGQNSGPGTARTTLCIPGNNKEDSMMTWENLGKALTTAAFAGVGLAALAGEQICKAGKVLAEKGEIYVAQGKKYGEELQQKLQEDAKRRQDERFDQQV